MKICPKCATENVNTAKFCDECGYSFLMPDEVGRLSSILEENDNGQQESQNELEQKSEELLHAKTPANVSAQETPSANKRKNLIIASVVVAISCIIIFMATRIKLKSLEVSYVGSTVEGVVLDSDNEGFEVVAMYSNGKKKEVPIGEWQIAEPQTLECDSSCNIKIKYKNISQDITIECSTTKISYIKATYNGAAYEGTIINNKSDITVIATCNCGYSFELNRNEWYLTPKEVTLKKDKPENIKLSADFNDNGETVTLSTVISITGIENKIESIEAEYNGSTYAGTVIDQKSDIEVEGKYSDGKVRDIDKENWSLDPERVTLEDGKKSKLKIIVEQDNGNTISTDLEIEGKEAPFTKPEIEGDHYNCSIDQFVDYVNKKTSLSLFPMDYSFGEGYKSYGVFSLNGLKIYDDEAYVLALKENEDGKLYNIVLWTSDQSTGMALALNIANIFDNSIDINDKSALVGFVTTHVYGTDNMVIYLEEKEDHYNIYFMTRDFFSKNFSNR